MSKAKTCRRTGTVRLPMCTLATWSPAEAPGATDTLNQKAVFSPAVNATFAPLLIGQSGSGYGPSRPRLSETCVMLTYCTW